jgi:flagellar basal body-associated protein FliL
VPEIDPKLKRQRLYIIIFVVVAALFAGGNILASLGTWQDNDAAAKSGAPAAPAQP